MFKQTANAMTHESRNTTFLKSKSFFLKKTKHLENNYIFFLKKSISFFKNETIHHSFNKSIFLRIQVWIFAKFRIRSRASFD